jgi:hypothetical protein
MNRLEIVVSVIMIVSLCSSSCLYGLPVQSASAFKPDTHIFGANVAIDEILSGSNAVTLNGISYQLDPRTADSIRNYPEYYRGGVVGPDGFPDIYFGQSIVHPDSRCENGALSNDCHYGTFSHEWLRYIYDAGWDYYESRNGDEEGQKALAFTYGYLTHAAGDMWAHTLVNQFAQGIFPSIEEIENDPSKLGIAARHIIVEAYISKHTPNTVLPISSPEDFIYRTFIEGGFVDSRGNDLSSLGRGEIFTYFFDLRDRLVQASADFAQQANACRWYDITCSAIAASAAKAYVDAWIDDIDSGLRAWPKMSQNVAFNLFTLNNFDAAVEVIDDFVGDHLLSMLGAPDFVGAAYNFTDNIEEFVERLLGPIVGPLEDFRNYMIKQATGLDIEALKEFLTSPENYINSQSASIAGRPVIPIGLAPDTSQKLDRMMGINNGVANPNEKFNPERFAPAKNTIVLTKLLLLSPSELNRVNTNHGVGPIYFHGDNGYGGDNAMLDFIRSLDANHQWRKSSLREGDFAVIRNAIGPFPFIGPRQHGEGMPLWVDCLTRERVFRALFDDWENTNFPDLGDICTEITTISRDMAVTISLENVTIIDLAPFPDSNSINNSNVNDDVSVAEIDPYVLRCLIPSTQDRLSVFNGTGNREEDPLCRTKARMHFDISINGQEFRFPRSGTIDIPLGETYYLQNEGKPINPPPNQGWSSSLGPVRTLSIDPISLALHGEPLDIRITATDHNKVIPQSGVGNTTDNQHPPQPAGGTSEDGAATSFSAVINQLCGALIAAQANISGSMSICTDTTGSSSNNNQEIHRTYFWMDKYGDGPHTEQSSSFYGEYFIITFSITARPLLEVNEDDDANEETLQHSGFFIQSTFGEKGNFELAVPHLDGGFDFLWRNNDVPPPEGQPWQWIEADGAGSELGQIDALSLIQSTFGNGGNLEIIARVDDGLVHFWRILNSDGNFEWHGPTPLVNSDNATILTSGVSGNPSVIQSTYGEAGNFELAVPSADRGFFFTWRDNDDPILSWGKQIPNNVELVGAEVGHIDALTLLQSNFGSENSPGNLEVAARVGDRLVQFWRTADSNGNFEWHGPVEIPNLTGVSGNPSVIQSNFGEVGNFELVVPAAEGGFYFLFRNNDEPGHPWSQTQLVGVNAGRLESISLIQSNFGEIGNLEVVARTVDNTTVNFWREDNDPFTWHGPFPIP